MSLYTNGVANLKGNYQGSSFGGSEENIADGEQQDHDETGKLLGNAHCDDRPPQEYPPLDDDDSRCYTYSTDEEGGFDSAKHGDGHASTDTTSSTNAGLFKTPKDAPISNVVTSKDERRHRESANRRINTVFADDQRQDMSRSKRRERRGRRRNQERGSATAAIHGTAANARERYGEMKDYLQPRPYHRQQRDQWPAAFQDERTHSNTGGYGSLFHPLSSPESTGQDPSSSPPMMSLPMPKLLPRNSESGSLSEDEFDDQRLGYKTSPGMETTPTLATTGGTRTDISATQEYDNGISLDRHEDESDEEIGHLPDHLHSSWRNGRNTIKGTAYVEQQHGSRSPVSAVTEAECDRSVDTSLTPPQDSMRSKREWDPRAQYQGGRSHQYLPLVPKPSYGSASASHHPKLSESCPSIATNKKALRRHQRKKEEAEAREHAVLALRGEEQPPKTASSDRIWGFLFILQLLTVIATAFILGPDALVSGDETTNSPLRSGHFDTKIMSDENPSLFDDDMVISKTVPVDIYYPDPSDESNTTTFVDDPVLNDTLSKLQVDYRNALQLCGITGLYSVALSSLTIGFMMILSSSIIQTALIFTILICFAWGTAGIVLSPYSFVPILGFIALALSLGYSVVVWDSIPFHAMNLNIALTGIRAVADTLLVGFSMTIITFLWCVVWSVACIGLYDYLSVGDEAIVSGTNSLILFALCISMMWTYNAFRAIIQAVVAGRIGQWWYDPESMKTCCSYSSGLSLSRALTSSFGSICYGSLFVKPIQLLKRLVSFMCLVPLRHQQNKMSKDKKRKKGAGYQPNDNSRTESPLTRMRWIILRGMESLCKVHNHWAFVYIGLYYYSFWESGKKATAVFNTRGWMTIVSDHLVRNVFFIASVVISLCTGCFGLIVEEFDGYTFTSFDKPIAVAFVLGSLIGYTLSGIMLSVLISATNAVLVCFAIGNVEFSRTHPQLSNEMKASWATVWSGYFVP